MKLIGKDTNRDVIIAYLTSRDADLQLSQKQKKLLDHYILAYDMIRNYHSVPDTIRALVKISAEKKEPISQSTARRYVYEALDVFGYSSEVRRESIRHLATEVLLDAIKFAKDKKDAKTMIMGARELAALFGADDSEAPNFDMLEPHVIEIMLDPEAMKLLKKLVIQGPLDLDSLMGRMADAEAEDVQFTEDGNTATPEED